MRLGSLFSGCGGLDMAANAVFGSSTAWHVEFEDAPSKVLAANWPGVPNHRDVTTVDWSAVGPVDILAGGFPCQDLSLAGRRAGMRPGTRSGLWADFVKAIDALNPSVVVIENVRGLLSGCAESDLEPCPGCVGDGEHRPVLRALGRVLGDLADLGFDAEWGGIRAADVGAPHGRYRVFVVAYSERVRRGSGRFARPVEAARGRAPAELAGRGGAPVTHLLPTPVTSDGTGGPRNEDTPNPQGFALQMRDIAGELGRTNFGQYEPAVRRWEALTRPAPAPTKGDGRDGNHRLSAEFVEWMQGYAHGHVTGHGLTRSEELRILGNTVVPQQGAEAIRQLWTRAVAVMNEEVAA